MGTYRQLRKTEGIVRLSRSYHTSFLESGVIDSTGILELIAFLEEEYGISIDDDEIIPENLDSLKNLSVFLQRNITN